MQMNHRSQGEMWQKQGKKIHLKSDNEDLLSILSIKQWNIFKHKTSYETQIMFYMICWPMQIGCFYVPQHCCTWAAAIYEAVALSGG